MMNIIEINPFKWDRKTLDIPYHISSNDILDRQNQFESNVRSYPRRIPIVIKRAKGIYVEDVTGRFFIDCLAGAGSLALGHNHEVVKEALLNTINSNHALHCLDLSTGIKDKFVQDVFEALPEKLRQKACIQFCGPSGADAVEAALKLVKLATSRSGIFSFHGGYHGMTHGALSVTGNLSPKKNIPNLMPGVTHLPYPYSLRCPFGVGGEEGEQISLHYIENILSDPESGVTLPAGIILEIIQGEAGVITPSKKWLQGIRRIATKYSVPLIIDEVQTGIGRTGSMFAFEQAGILPDVLVLSKAIGGGLPLSVLVFDKSIDKWMPGNHTGTFRGNQLGMAAGSATLNFMKETNIIESVKDTGNYFISKLNELKAKFPVIGEVRGRGLMIGVEIVNPIEGPDALGQYPAFNKMSSTIQRECLKRGMIIELGGRHSSTLRFLPPLIITKNEVDDIIDILTESLTVSINQIFDKYEIN